MPKPPECNILGIPFRWVSVVIAVTLLLMCLCLIITYSFRNQITCKPWRHGIESLIFQHDIKVFIQFKGDENWALTGLVIAIVCLLTNTALLWGAVYYIPRLILLWYLGALPQFFYLISLQIFCLVSRSCSRCLAGEDAHVYRHSYTFGFGMCLFLTLYFYSTFIWKVQLCYSHVMDTKRPSPEPVYSATSLNLQRLAKKS